MEQAGQWVCVCVWKTNETYHGISFLRSLKDVRRFCYNWLLQMLYLEHKKGLVKTGLAMFILKSRSIHHSQLLSSDTIHVKKLLFMSVSVYTKCMANQSKMCFVQVTTHSPMLLQEEIEELRQNLPIRHLERYHLESFQTETEFLEVIKFVC